MSLMCEMMDAKKPKMNQYESEVHINIGQDDRGRTYTQGADRPSALFHNLDVYTFSSLTVNKTTKRKAECAHTHTTDQNIPG